MLKRYFIRALWTMILSTLRFFTHLMVRKRNILNREKKPYKETVKNMKFLEEMLLENNYLDKNYHDLTDKMNHKAAEKAVNAFVSKKEKREDEDFYFLVAQEWVKELDKKSFWTSLVFLGLFFALCGATIGLTQIVGDIQGNAVWVIVTALFSSIVLGIFNSLRSRGWRRWSMFFAHVLTISSFFFLIIFFS
ncbi:hypothetical protein GLW04_12125 [Halobacillus litoralis]|uniref:Uncharacterized protein n=1 Tax=Halobacillus litoralis TaxID=45668 RepID=A0A845E4Q2_9BACI|nr:hypothetical protein [Halobacillus litoralis]MYL20644.1 hypothetical protein [Halobacillus litoralis]MYL39234.1 hypothetical protein [Halobacillus litoralis]